MERRIRIRGDALVDARIDSKTGDVELLVPADELPVTELKEFVYVNADLDDRDRERLVEDLVAAWDRALLTTWFHRATS